MGFEQTIIADKTSYLKVLTNSHATDQTPEASGGGREHIALKMLRSEWLQQKRGFDSSMSIPFADTSLM